MGSFGGLGCGMFVNRLMMMLGGRAGGRPVCRTFLLCGVGGGEEDRLGNVLFITPSGTSGFISCLCNPKGMSLIWDKAVSVAGEGVITGS